MDTNVFLFATFEEYAQHEKAVELVNQWQQVGLPWYGTWSIFYEFMRVSTHPAVRKHPLRAEQAWACLKTFLSLPGFSLLTETDQHERTVDGIVQKHGKTTGNLWHDVHTVALMQEHGIKKIYTADTDFYRFKEIEVANPF